MPNLHFNVKSVIFDLDGVITNTMPDHYRAWKWLLKREGVNVTYEDIYCREGQRGIQSIEEIFSKYNKAFDAKYAHWMLKEKEEYFKKRIKCRYINGSRSFLKKLSKCNFSLALVTGTSHHEMVKMLPEGIRNLFSVIVTGCEVKHGKPHPQPFLRSLERLKIKRSEAVVIENAPLGIQSAKRAGLKCLALETSLPRKYLSEADGIYSSIKELSSRVQFQLKE